jgi:hypothetical protein
MGSHRLLSDTDLLGYVVNFQLEGRKRSYGKKIVHLLGSFNPISQSQIMDKYVKVKLLNQYGLNLDNRHSLLIASAPQVNGLFVVDRVLAAALESTKFTDIDNNICLWPLQTTGHAS